MPHHSNWCMRGSVRRHGTPCPPAHLSRGLLIELQPCLQNCTSITPGLNVLCGDNLCLPYNNGVFVKTWCDPNQANEIQLAFYTSYGCTGNSTGTLSFDDRTCTPQPTPFYQASSIYCGMLAYTMSNMTYELTWIRACSGKRVSQRHTSVQLCVWLLRRWRMSCVLS